MKIGADSVIVLDIRQYAGVLFLVIIRFSPAEKSYGVFAREKWRQRKRGAVGRLAPVNATRNVGRYLYPQNPYVLLLSEGICGLNQHLFKVTSSNYDKWFYYSWTKHHLDRFVAVAADKATTMGHIKRDELAKAEVLIPNEADYKRIRTLLQPIYDLIITNRIENKRLAKIRDILLPKLMSGELDVSAIQL